MIPMMSIVIPLYNKEPHIKRAIDSVLTQKVQDFEIIIVDDGSTDKSAEVVKRFTDPRIRLIQQENSGVSAARNRGIEEAKADLVAFLDADDEWTPSFLETILRLREKYPEAGAYSTAYAISRNNQIKNVRYKEVPSFPWEGLLPSYFLSVASGTHPVCSSAICIPIKVIYETGDFQVNVIWGEDEDLWGRIALKYPVAFSNQIGAIYHKEAINRTGNLYPIKEHPFIKSAQSVISNGEMNQKKLNDLRECIAMYQILTAVRNIKCGHSKIARNNLRNCQTKLLFRKRIFWMVWATVPNRITNKLINIALNVKIYLYRG